MGSRCSEACPGGTYGYYCNKTCPTNCANSACNKETGSCICKDSYSGPLCEVYSGHETLDDTSGQKETCSIACILAVVFAILFLLVTGLLIAFFIRSMRNKKSNLKAANHQTSMTVVEEDKRNQSKQVRELNDGSHADYYNVSPTTYESLDAQTTREIQDTQVDGNTYQSLQHN